MPVAYAQSYLAVRTLVDRHGAHRVFIAVSLLAIVPMLAITHVPPWPAWALLAVTTCFVVLVSGRFPAHAALLGGLVDPARRAGAFAINGAGIAIAMGGAAVASGQLTARQADGTIAGYGLLGLLAAGITLASLPLAIRLRREVAERFATGPITDAYESGLAALVR